MSADHPADAADRIEAEYRRRLAAMPHVAALRAAHIGPQHPAFAYATIEPAPWAMPEPTQATPDDAEHPYR